jgi:hypothetical protein
MFTPLACNDNNVCTDDGCNPATGCVYTNNTLPCTDNNACTENDACSAGVCAPGTPRLCIGGIVCDPQRMLRDLDRHNFTLLMANGYIMGGTNDVKLPGTAPFKM